MDSQETQRQERIGTQSVRVIRAITPYGHELEDYFFPVNISQVRELKASILTRLEMLNLSKKAEDAAKIVIDELVWQWFYEVEDNSTTSGRGCIAPIVMKGEWSPTDNEEPSNRWGWNSEQEFIDAITLTNNPQADKE